MAQRDGLRLPVPGPDEMRPHAASASPGRGALAFLTPYRSVMRFGNDPDGVSPARARYTPGRPAHVATRVPAPIYGWQGLGTAEMGRPVAR